VEGVEHEGGSSQVACSDGTRIPGCMVLDATGHARKLVEYDKPFNPGFQVASCSVQDKVYVMCLVAHLVVGRF